MSTTTTDSRPANMKGMPAIEGFADEALDAMGKLALALAELASEDVDDEVVHEMLDAIGVVVADVRAIRNEAVSTTGAPPWTAGLAPELPAVVVQAIGQLDAAVTSGDFALAHRLLVVLEKVATGTDADLATLCEPRAETPTKHVDA